MMQWWTEVQYEAPIPVTPETVFQLLLAAFFIGLAVAWTSRLARGPAADLTPGMATTLTLLTMLVALVTIGIGNNTARAFGLVGALSIVRFRTSVEDTRDTVFVILAVTIGMTIGAGYVKVALVALVVVAAAAFLLRLILNPPGLFGSLTVRVKMGTDVAPLQTLVARHLSGCKLVSVLAKKEEMIELTFRGSLRDDSQALPLITELSKRDGVQIEQWQVR
jgi:uncharacterized membrane protein YhiD involved in acid resistance